MLDRIYHAIVVSSLAMLVGCASQSSQHVETTQPSVAGEAQMKKPFMFNEATLPAGFPRPGPVGEVIVKQYPAARAATVSTKTLGAPADENRMFSPLFNHIKKNKISMTSPVEMTRDAKSDKAESMAFFYGDTSIGKTGPDEKVEVVDVAPLLVLSVGVRGSYNQSNFGEGVKKLNDWLAANPNQYQVTGPPRMLGYNSPFVPWFWRYSEVQLPVQRVN